MRYLLDDRPLLIIASHLGNFEVGGYVLGILGFPTYTVARTLDNPYLDRFVNEFRGRTGQHMIPKNGGLRPDHRVLADGGTMTFLADQYAGPKGCWVNFSAGPPPPTRQSRCWRWTITRECRFAPRSVSGRPMRFELCNYAMIDPQDGRQFGGHGPRTDAMVHDAAGGTHPACARPILVAAPPLERHAREEAAEESGVMIVDC